MSTPRMADNKFATSNRSRSTRCSAGFIQALIATIVFGFEQQGAGVTNR